MQDDLEELLNTIDEYAEFINVKTNVEICRDERIIFLLSLSVDGDANFLLTRDKDLLDLKFIGNTEIKTIANFMEHDFNKILK